MGMISPRIVPMMTMESETPLWYFNFAFPLMGAWNNLRLNRYADQFGFTDDTISRKKYQRRFAFGLGIPLKILIKIMHITLLFRFDLWASLSSIADWSPVPSRPGH